MIPELVQEKKDRVIYKGDTMRFTIPVNARGSGTVAPFDVQTGFTARMQFRETPTSATPIITLDETAGLTLKDGSIDVVLTAAQTAALLVSQMVSDCQITETASGEKKTVEVATYRITEDITKDA